jgi:hypothetical protein
MRVVRLLAAVVVVLAMAQVAIAAESWISFDGLSQEAASVSVVESDMSRLVLSIDVPGVFAEEVTTSGGTFARLTLDGSGPTAVVGEALLPVVRELIEIPYGTDPVLTVTYSDYRRAALTDLGIRHDLIPVQAPVVKMPGALESASFEFSANYYGRDSFGEYQPASLSEVQTMRGHRFVQLEVNPVRYNPARGELEYATTIEVTVDFPGAELTETRRVLDRYSNGRFAQVAADMFINHAAFVSRYDIPLPIGYLIVCYDSFTDEIAPLAAWKEQKGYHTTVVSTSDIPGGNTKENIKAYIQDAYDTWDVPPTFVLLVGDTPQISHWVGTQSNSPSTDLYYVTMDGSSDWLPDMWVGRFSCTTGSQVTNLVDKTVDYERFNLTSGTAWIKKAVFMASEDNYTVSEGTHNYVIREYLDDAGYYSQRLFCHTYNATTAQVTAAFNDGRSLGIYSGHGAVTYWADGPYFTASNVNALTNADMLPLVHSYSCLTGQFSSSCFGETWTNATDKGAVVFWGSSVTSYWNEDDVLEKGAFKACFEEGYTWACGISHRALYWLYDHYSGGGSTRRYYEMYNILGDPSLDIWTDVPGTISANYSGTVPVGSTSFDITVTSSGSPIDNALVCVAKDDDGVYEAAYTNASGQATILLSPTPTTPGTMEVTVTKHDHYPHEGSTIVSITDSPYVVYESHIIDDDTSGDSIGDGDGVADAGEYIELVMTLENIGNQPGTGITALISEGEPDVLVSDSYEEYGDIAVGATAQCYEDYDIYIAPSCPDGYLVQLQVEATDGDSTWVSVCFIPVSAPVLSIYGYDVDDSPTGGNGNGCIEAGETVTLSVTFQNTGGDDARDASVEMTTGDPYITITQGTAGPTLIPSGGTGTPQPEFEFTVSPGAPAFHEFMLDFAVSTPSGYSAYDDIALLVGAMTLEENFEGSGTDWTHYNVTSGFADQWHVETYRSHSADTSWKFGGSGAGNYTDSADGALETPNMCVGAEGEMTFWSWLDAEEESATSAWDCALVEISTDNGETWSNLAPVGGYSHVKNNNPDNPLPTGTPCWSGTHTWREETFDLTPYEGQSVTFRFRFASDGYVTQEGWYIDDISITSMSTGVSDSGSSIPTRFALKQNVPNPFNPMTTIAYSLPEAAHVIVRVYSVAGRHVATLRDGVEEAGQRSVVWDGTNDRGQSVGSGIYFCSMTAGEFSDRKMMVLLK